MQKPELREFFYRFEGFDLIRGPKAAGFVLVVATEALARLHAVEVAVEEYQQLQMRALERISRIEKMKKTLLSRAQLVLFPGTAMPMRFVTDPVFGASIGAEPETLGRLAEEGVQAVEHVGSVVEYTPHNCDTPVQALMLFILAQTWAEWAHDKLLLQHSKSGRL